MVKRKKDEKEKVHNAKEERMEKFGFAKPKKKGKKR